MTVDVQLNAVAGVRVERVSKLVADVHLAGAERTGVEARPATAAQRAPDFAEAGRDSEHGNVLGRRLAGGGVDHRPGCGDHSRGRRDVRIRLAALNHGGGAIASFQGSPKI